MVYSTASTMFVKGELPDSICILRLLLSSDSRCRRYYHCNMEDATGLARMRLNALNAAQQEFNWEKESPSLIHLYRDILAMQDKGQPRHGTLSKSAL